MVLAVGLFIPSLYLVSSFQFQRCSLSICTCGFAMAIHLLPWTETVPVPGMSAHPEGSDFQWPINIPW